MEIYTLNKTGQLHVNHSEDHLFYTDIEKNWFIGAVMDGCSSGIESHFAANLFGKLIRKACNTFPYLERINPEFKIDEQDHEFLGQFILNLLFDDLKKSRQLLALDLEEVLTTLILLVYNKNQKSAWINISGDGLIANNEEIIEIDHEKTPDYMAYHQDIEFDAWRNEFSKTFTFENLSNLAISTDGVSKFLSSKNGRPSKIDPVQYLLSDNSLSENPDMLEAKCGILEKDHKLVPFDDLGIIRLIIS